MPSAIGMIPLVLGYVGLVDGIAAVVPVSDLNDNCSYPHFFSNGWTVILPKNTHCAGIRPLVCGSVELVDAIAAVSSMSATSATTAVTPTSSRTDEVSSYSEIDKSISSLFLLSHDSGRLTYVGGFNQHCITVTQWSNATGRASAMPTPDSASMNLLLIMEKGKVKK